MQDGRSSCINRLSERYVSGRKASRRVVFNARGVCKRLLRDPDAPSNCDTCTCHCRRLSYDRSCAYQVLSLVSRIIILPSVGIMFLSA